MHAMHDIWLPDNAAMFVQGGAQFFLWIETDHSTA